MKLRGTGWGTYFWRPAIFRDAFLNIDKLGASDLKMSPEFTLERCRLFLGTPVQIS